jgi:hypothetical protein
MGDVADYIKRLRAIREKIEPLDLPAYAYGHNPLRPPSAEERVREDESYRLTAKYANLHMLLGELLAEYPDFARAGGVPDLIPGTRIAPDVRWLMAFQGIMGRPYMDRFGANDAAAIDKLIKAIEPQQEQLNTADAIEPPSPKKRGRPSPSEKEKAEDRRIVEAWETGHYRTYRELARELNSKPRLIEMAIDRHRSRKKSTEEMPPESRQ